MFNRNAAQFNHGLKNLGGSQSGGVLVISVGSFLIGVLGEYLRNKYWRKRNKPKKKQNLFDEIWKPF